MRTIVHHHLSVAEADGVVAAIRERGGEATALRADLAHFPEVERLARDAEAVWGRVDVLVNSAATFSSAGLPEVDEALWDHTLAVNLKAPFFLTRALAEGMRERGQGVVINLGDLSGVQVWNGYAAHAISKAGLIHFTRVAARALAPEIRVAAIVPGTVLPPEWMTADEVERLGARAPLRRTGSPEDVVRALLYLLDADFVTGEILTVDGGRGLGTARE